MALGRDRRSLMDILGEYIDPHPIFVRIGGDVAFVFSGHETTPQIVNLLKNRSPFWAPPGRFQVKCLDSRWLCQPFPATNVHIGITLRTLTH